MFNNIFSANRAVYKIIWKTPYSRADHRRHYGACALHPGYKQTLRLCNTSCFSTATI